MANNLEQYPEVIKILKKIGEKSVTTYKKNLKEKNKIASGKLYNSISYKVELTETGCKLIFVAEKYYINVENGRKAGGKMPSVEVIKRWMQLKNIVPKKGLTINETAYAISRSISKKGIKANPFLREIKVDLKKEVPSITKALQIDLKVNVKNISNKLKNKGNKYIQFKK